MSSGYPGGHPDYFNLNSNNTITPRSISMMNLTNNYRSPLAGIITDQSSRRPDLIGKRSLAEFQHHQQLQQQAAFYLRNVKQKSFIHNHNHNNMMDFSSSPEISSVSNMTSSFSTIPRYGVPLLQQQQQIHHPLNVHKFSFNRYSLPQSSQKQETEGKMMKQLQELEKQLLLDDDEDGENDVSGVTNSEWSETIQNILSPPVTTKPENIVSPSPTSSSSSSCASSSASPATVVCSKQLLSEAAGAISEGKSEAANEILTRLNHVSNARGTPEQRLSFYMTVALRSRMNLVATTTTELYGKDHILSTQLLYDKSPCFKLGFMAANATILEAGKKIHILDFDIGQGLQYVYLLREVAAAREARESENGTPFTLKLTTFQDFGNGGIENLKHVGDRLKNLANKFGVTFSFNILNLKLSEVNTTSLMVASGEVLVVNFGFKLYKLPDESVTTENLRDEVLRRVKGLSPDLVTVVEQELNGNTASFETRVSQACGYYGALIESLDATIGRENLDRVKIEEGLSRKIMNSVAYEGRDRVERCEVFGKWRARMSMAGFKLSQLNVESLLMKVNSITRGNPGFTAKEDGGGISLGWMGRTLTVASAWN